MISKVPGIDILIVSDFRIIYQIFESLSNVKEFYWMRGERERERERETP